MKKSNSKLLLTGSFLALFLMAGQVQATVWDFSITGYITDISGCNVPTPGSCPFDVTVPDSTIDITGSYDDFYLFDNGFGGTSVDLYETGNMEISFGSTAYSTALPSTDSWEWLPLLDFIGSGTTATLDGLDFDVWGAESHLVSGYDYDSGYSLFTNLLLGSTNQIIGTVDGYWGNFAQWDATGGNVGNEPPSAVPVPAAIWLFGTALLGLVGFGKRKDA